MQKCHHADFRIAGDSNEMPITGAQLMKLGNQWVCAACHYLSQFSRDRVESYMSVYSNPAGSMESSRSSTNICSAPHKPAANIG